VTLSRSAALRVGLIVLVAVLVQVSVVAQVPIFGGRANLIPVAVAALALLGGSLTGAAAGFAAGLALDLSMGMSLGGSSLVLTFVGYSLGRFAELRDVSHGLLPIAVAAAGTLGYDMAYGAVTFMLDIEATISVLVLRDMLVGVLLNALLALPLFALVRRIVRPLVPEGRFEGRRRGRPREAGPIGLRGLGLGGG
jgi:rod shape-determining protein MreD